VSAASSKMPQTALVTASPTEGHLERKRASKNSL
jgi:hypothetical protein